MVTDELQFDIQAARSTFKLKARATLKPGVTVLYGPSGSGKTTILNCISGLLSPLKGNIVFRNNAWFNHDSRIDVPPQVRQVGYVFQNIALFPHLTVAQNISYGFNGGKLNEHGTELTKLFKIDQLLDRKPAQLSGGQSQCVALARALSLNPQLVLLDEPFNALDTQARIDTFAVLKQLQQKAQSTVLLVTHLVEEALDKADHVIEMSEVLY